MEKENVTSLSSALQEVQRQFEQWRESRKRREPIPERLWQAAMELCKRRSVVWALRLNHADLKKRTEISTQDSAALPEFQFPRPLPCVQWTKFSKRAKFSPLNLILRKKFHMRFILIRLY